jgi:LacI family transcriptional regulator
MATFYEMAKLAGMSPATVSRAFTVVRLPAWHIGGTAARMLLERVAGDDQPARTVVLRSELQPAHIPARG